MKLMDPFDVFLLVALAPSLRDTTTTHASLVCRYEEGSGVADHADWWELIHTA